MLGIFIFRRDLRLQDNLALINLTKECDRIIPIFILDKNQIELNNNNKYYISNNAIQFICESLESLNKELHNKLLLFYGYPEQIIEDLIKLLINKNKEKDICVGFNLDFTEYSLKRDKKILDKLKKYNISNITNEDDNTLISMNNLIKTDNNPYIIYGSFYKNAIKTKVNKPKNNNYKNYYSPKQLKDKSIDINKLTKLYKYNKNLAHKGGRDNGLKIMNNKYIYKNYNNKSNNLDFNTYNISSYLNFGCISIREFYNIIYKNKNLTKNLYWRDFYYSILRYNKEARSYTSYINSRFDKIKWKNDYNGWKSMIESKTGYLLIDAIIKELLITGYINNRSRLLLGTFWIKYLLINPFDKKYGAHTGFSKLLVDCITSQNKLNHQWLISDLDLSGRRFSKKNENSLTGRVIRIDNKMISKYDSEAIYIKKWIPELKDIPIKDLINWDIKYINYNVSNKPIFNWEKRYQEYCNLFDKI